MRTRFRLSYHRRFTLEDYLTWVKDAHTRGQVKFYEGPGDGDFLRNLGGHGVAIAQLLAEGSDEVLATGYAFCSKRDQFSRKRGRMIAMGRAMKEWSRRVPA